MHVRKNKDQPYLIDKEYGEMVIAHMNLERQGEAKAFELACEVLNKVSKRQLNATMLAKFRQMSIERDEEFAKVHKGIKDSTEATKPKAWKEQKAITEEEAKEAWELKKKLEKEIAKTQADYKDLVEETYMRVISEGHYNASGTEHAELEKMKLEAMILARIIESKAYDCVRVELGINEAQIQ